MPQGTNESMAGGHALPDAETLTARAIIDRLLEAAKIGAWPFTVIFILLFLRVPLLNVLDQIPDLMKSAKTISIGAYKIEINENEKRAAANRERPCEKNHRISRS